MTGSPAPRLTADPAGELAGRDVRRLTRRAAAARAELTLLGRAGDVLGHLVTGATVIALLGGSLQSFRTRMPGITRPLTGPPLPGAVTGLAVWIMALAGVIFVLDRLGPLNATPAAAAWWLPLPAGRRGLLLGQLARTTGVLLAVAVGVAVAPVVALTSHPTPATVLVGLGWAAAPAAVAVAITAVLQTRDRSGLLAPVAGAIAALTALVVLTLAATTAIVPGALRLPATLAPPTWIEAALGALAVLLLTAAARGLDRITATQLRGRGAVAGYAAASVLSLDTRDLGRALSGPARRPKHSRRFAFVTRPWIAGCAADVAVLARDRLRWGQLLLAVGIPELIAHIRATGSVPLAVWAACAAGWLLAAVAVAAPARAAHATPAIDRLLPLSTSEVVGTRFVVPLVVLAVVCALTGLLLGLGTGAVGEWVLIALAGAPSWAAAALRGAYRPDLDWSGELLATPFGPVPVGVIATMLQGIDVGVVGSLPLLLAFLHGGPTPALVAGQLGWSLALSAIALSALARRLGRRSSEP